MDKLEYQITMHRINEIGQEQLSCLDYVCRCLDYMVDVQKENVRSKMLRLQKEKQKFLEYIKLKNP